MINKQPSGLGLGRASARVSLRAELEGFSFNDRPDCKIIHCRGLVSCGVDEDALGGL